MDVVDLTQENENFDVWQGVYQTYEDADSVANAFGSERWLDRMLSQLLDYRSLVESAKPLMVLPPRPSDLPFLCALSKAQTILDFGGSSGWTFEYLQNSLTDHSVKSYQILEMADLVAHMEQRNFHEPPIHYVTNIDGIGQVDIFYSNSVVQYISDDRLFLNLIAQMSPDYILLDDFYGGPFDDYFTLQRYYEHQIPVKHRNRNNFIDCVKALGYKLTMSKPYPSVIHGKIDVLPMSALPEDKRIRHGETLFFERYSISSID